jgi:hypothetical protein
VTRLPLWFRWLLSLVVFTALAAGLVLALRGSDSSSQNQDASALLRANQQGRSFLVRDQSPRSASLAKGVGVRQALQTAIAADMRSRVRRGQLSGPLQAVRCLPASSARPRRPYRCVARTASFGYPFFAVSDRRRSQLTWCKYDAVPAGQGPVAVSPRCRA